MAMRKVRYGLCIGRPSSSSCRSTACWAITSPAAKRKEVERHWVRIGRLVRAVRYQVNIVRRIEGRIEGRREEERKEGRKLKLCKRITKKMRAALEKKVSFSWFLLFKISWSLNFLYGKSELAALQRCQSVSWLFAYSAGMPLDRCSGLGFPELQRSSLLFP